MSRGSTKAVGTRGFGVPDVVDPHHWIVTIPKARGAAVSVVEQFGVSAAREGMPDRVERVRLARDKWQTIAEPVRRVLNERLAAARLEGSRWNVGDNMVERLLGKELCILAWAVEHAASELVPVAVTNWSGLKPEERWWLFTMTAAATGGVDDGDKGWRKALRYALTENPTDAEAADAIARDAARVAPAKPSGRKRMLNATDHQLDMFGSATRKDS